MKKTELVKLIKEAIDEQYDNFSAEQISALRALKFKRISSNEFHTSQHRPKSIAKIHGGLITLNINCPGIINCILYGSGDGLNEVLDRYNKILKICGI